jgi:hypothetical protein
MFAASTITCSENRGEQAGRGSEKRKRKRRRLDSMNRIPG